MEGKTMQTSTWIIIAVVVVLLLVAIAYIARRRRHQQLAERATELRTHAAERDQDVAEERRRAAEAEAQAQLKRAEAERAEEQARNARQSHLQEEAHQEDILREADRIDPRVDGRGGDRFETTDRTEPTDGRAEETSGTGFEGTGARRYEDTTPETDAGQHRRDV
jgi:FtsZ-interacting cell division protein ZipA